MISPLMLFVILPTVVAMLPGVELNWIWAMVPLTNVSLAMKELVKGTMDYRMFGVILLSTTVIAGALLALCRWWFNRESGPVPQLTSCRAIASRPQRPVRARRPPRPSALWRTRKCRVSHAAAQYVLNSIQCQHRSSPVSIGRQRMSQELYGITASANCRRPTPMAWWRWTRSR